MAPFHLEVIKDCKRKPESYIKPRGLIWSRCVTVASTRKKSLWVRGPAFCFVSFRCVKLSCVELRRTVFPVEFWPSSVIKTTPDKMDFTRQHFLHKFCNRRLQDKKKNMQFSKCFILSRLTGSDANKSTNLCKSLCWLKLRLFNTAGTFATPPCDASREQHCEQIELTGQIA